ncbi:hypothetical protein RRG08_039061 [Elysia crispata]|uniref:Uncharacterized protein n=1 Tax=Elysia crispata TaxID=231223 RepID=A0AAE1A6Q9_9GAST|nr:hypothetical protein RRG08_039061 [Elysia crispata]
MDLSLFLSTTSFCLEWIALRTSVEKYRQCPVMDGVYPHILSGVSRGPMVCCMCVSPSWSYVGHSYKPTSYGNKWDYRMEIQRRYKSAHKKIVQDFTCWCGVPYAQKIRPDTEGFNNPTLSDTSPHPPDSEMFEQPQNISLRSRRTTFAPVQDKLSASASFSCQRTWPGA